MVHYEINIDQRHNKGGAERPDPGVGCYIDSTHMKVISDGLRRELEQIALAKGINMSKMAGTSGRGSAVPASARYSTLQDLDAGRHTEIDMFSGTLMRIGGNPIGCEKPGWEFNFGNDVEAANTVLHCGGDIWMIPNTVYGTMHIGFGEIQRRIAPYGEIGRLLYENLISFYETENASWSAGESWSLGDSPAVGVTLEPNCGSFMYCKVPEVQEDTSYRYPENSPQIRVYTSINSRFIIEDFISKLQILYG